MWPFVRRNRLAPVERLHDSIAALARDRALFTDLGVADSFEGRFELLTLHLALVLRRLSQLPQPADEMAQDLADLAFRHLDDALREIGVGDLGVPRRMKTLAKAFYGRAAAYDAALSSKDRKGLVEALRRNVFDGKAGDADALATRVETIEGELSELSLDALLAGALDTLDRLATATGGSR
jgi:cytochrome b pre-mRNA-processing protein 3